MPVVFTSTDDTLATKISEITYLVNQSPQVWLDHQVQQHAGALIFHSYAIEDLFPANQQQGATAFFRKRRVLSSCCSCYKIVENLFNYSGKRIRLKADFMQTISLEL